MKIVDTRALERNGLVSLLAKKPFDRVTTSDNMKAGIKKIFGTEMTVQDVVDRIVEDVRENGDKSALQYTLMIDGVDFSKQGMQVTEGELAEAYGKIKPEVLEAIRKAIDNVECFHREQLPKSWLSYREHGCMLGQNITPLERVGIYVPGGTATYPSSVIMNAIPAKVAGVKEIIMVVPPAQDGSVDPYVLIAAQEIGVQKIFKIGGAQAIAALAFGTESIPKVDKITGPGNIFVTLAKKSVYGHCDIDMLAGPSEILIIADSTANPAYIAADLLGQAEHDRLAGCILVTCDENIANATLSELELQKNKLPRTDIATTALDSNGLILLCKDLQKAVEIANISAPEHLEILTESPFELLPYVKNAGAIFLGEYSPEPLGDYFAGPNHVLPTGGTARFYSVLNTEMFMKKSSVIYYTASGLEAVKNDIIAIANAEGLQAHARAVEIRFTK